MRALFAQIQGGVEGQAPMPLWYEIATRFGLPVALLAFFVWHYLKTSASHAKVIEAKDKEIAALNDKIASYYSWFVNQISGQHIHHQAEVTRINELRVKETHDHMSRMYERDEQSMELLQQTDRTLTTILEKLR